MKYLKPAIVAGIFALLVVSLVHAQSDTPPTDTAKSFFSWLIENGPTILMGIISTQLVKIPKGKIPEHIDEALRKAILVGAGIVIPAIFVWLGGLVGPLADYLDANGYWAAIIAVTGASFVWYRVESIFAAATTWLSASAAAKLHFQES